MLPPVKLKNRRNIARLTTQGFATLTGIVKDIAEQCCGERLVSLLEGGYHLEGLAASVEAHIKVLL